MSVSSALPGRSGLVDLANRILGGLDKTGIVPRLPLDLGLLCDRARRETGLQDFADDWFLQPMEVLIESVAQEADLNPLGHLAATGQFMKVLREQLWTRHWMEQLPEVFAQPLPPPVVVVGPMRSGTTRLHRLLAADGRFEHMRFFEAVCPVPPPDFRPGHRDPRPRQAGRLLSLVHRLNPRTAVIHPTGPHEPEEELGLLVQSAWGMKHEAQWRVPGYGAWSDGQDPTPAYRHLARLLQLVRWARGHASPSKPWVLKTPQHMLDLPALLRVFPDARLIFTHRDPLAVVASSCSLVWNQMSLYSDSADADWIGRHWLAKTHEQIDRMRRARRSIAPRQRMDVSFAEMDRDWQGVMRRIYAFLEMDLAPAMPAMRRHVERSARHRTWSRHRYDLTSYGLQSREVSSRFADYKDEFALETKVRKPSRSQPGHRPDRPRVAFA